MKNLKKTLLACSLIMFTSVIFAQLGVGVRLGDPYGLSLKKYAGSKNAIELNVGIPSYLSGYDWNYYYTKDSRYNNRNLYDVGYRGGDGIAAQVHFLRHEKLDLGFRGLKWYWGPGAQLRYQTGRFTYWENNIYYEDRFTNLDFGADITIGLEYTFEDYPIAIAADITGFLEIIDRPYLHPQSGVSVRWNLNR